MIEECELVSKPVSISIGGRHVTRAPTTKGNEPMPPSTPSSSSRNGLWWMHICILGSAVILLTQCIASWCLIQAHVHSLTGIEIDLRVLVPLLLALLVLLGIFRYNKDVSDNKDIKSISLEMFRDLWTHLQTNQLNSILVLIVVLLINFYPWYLRGQLQDRMKLRFELIAGNDQQKYSLVPPVPLSLQGEPNSLNYDPQFKQLIEPAARCNCIFLLGPAGVGKSPAINLVRRSYGRACNWNKEQMTVLHIRLATLVSEEEPVKWTHGTNEGLKNIRTVPTTSGQSIDLYEWFVQQHLHKWKESDQLFECTDEPTWVKAFRAWCEVRMSTSNGVLIVIDDLDEVGAATLNRVLRLSSETMKSVISKGRGHRITIALSGRGEILDYSTGFTDLNQLVIEQASQAPASKPAALQTHLIRPLPTELSNRLRVRERMRDSFFVTPKPSADIQSAVLKLWEKLLWEDKDPAIHEVTSYVESANFTSSLLSEFVISKRSYNQQDFVGSFYAKWWKRNAVKHGFPGEMNEEAIKLQRQWLNRLLELGRDSHTIIPEKDNILRLTGFIDLEPLRPLPSMASRIRCQFPEIIRIQEARIRNGR
jgi:hypothetical protein